MNKLVSFCLILIGVINLIPLAGLFSTQNLESAYSISLVDNDLIILMRHRALLFGILGCFIIYSAFNKFLQNAAIFMASTSMIGFVVLAYSVGDYNPSIYKVLLVDIAGIVIGIITVVLKYGFKRN